MDLKTVLSLLLHEITIAFVAVAMVVGVIYLAATGQAVPDELKVGLGTVLGYLFHSQLADGGALSGLTN